MMIVRSGNSTIVIPTNVSTPHHNRTNTTSLTCEERYEEGTTELATCVAARHKSEVSCYWALGILLAIGIVFVVSFIVSWKRELDDWGRW